jgi:diketogulonate reductase-like aldo/keto reductase
MPIVDLLSIVAEKKGTRDVAHLNENLGALRVELSGDDLEQLEAEFAKLTVHGERMNEMQMGLVDHSL